MVHCNTVTNQIVKIFSRHEFETLAKKHHIGQRFRSYNRWSQFIAMMVAQLSSRKSLRDLTENLKAQKHKLYHLGMQDTFRATLARVNEKQPYTLFEAMFYKLLARCQQFAPKHKFNFKAKLYLLDATIIDLCLSLFPWATFRKTKGAIKLHLGLDADGYLPTFLSLTEGKSHEIKWARILKLPRGSFVVFDRAFNDYGWYQSLIESGIFFVTRLKTNTLFLGPHIQPRSATKGEAASSGVLKPRHFLGWLLIRDSMQAIFSSLILRKSVPFGKFHLAVDLGSSHRNELVADVML